MDGDKQYPIERFDPLLRNLVGFDLVVRSSAAQRGSWRLTDAAQRRLDELVGSLDPISAEQMVYLDHQCADCHLHVRTRVHDGLYLCDSCIDRRTTPVTNAGAPEVAKRRWRRHHRRLQGSTPVAS